MLNMKDNVEWNRSILVSINTNNLDSIDIIPVSKYNGILDIDTSEEFRNDISFRSSCLTDCFELEKKANILANELWNRYYKSYYLCLVPSTNISFRKMVKDIIKRFIHREKNSEHSLNETMLLHNIQIETHRWLVERYLYNKNNEANGVLLNEKTY
jgi:uncharacterized metal-binding protein